MLTMTTGGLLLDMMGVALLFFFPPSLPAHEKPVGNRVTAGPHLVAERKQLAQKRKRSNRIARLALGLLFLGFGLQIIGK